MSKRELKKYLHSLKKEELEEQLIDLYERFANVKEFYTFVFNPNEKKLMEEAKLKIAKEYFPNNGRKPKARRSVAQKYFKHYLSLGVDAPLIADLMLYNIEIAQAYSAEKNYCPDSFYKSLLGSFQQVHEFVVKNGYLKDFEPRIKKITLEANRQKWINRGVFNELMIRENKSKTEKDFSHN
jgi:hypothetical protein